MKMKRPRDPWRQALSCVGGLVDLLEEDEGKENTWDQCDMRDVKSLRSVAVVFMAISSRAMMGRLSLVSLKLHIP